MTNSKSFAAFLLMLVCIFTLSSCSENNNSEDSTKAVSSTASESSSETESRSDVVSSTEGQTVPSTAAPTVSQTKKETTTKKVTTTSANVDVSDGTSKKTISNYKTVAAGIFKDNNASPVPLYYKGKVYIKNAEYEEDREAIYLMFKGEKSGKTYTVIMDEGTDTMGYIDLKGNGTLSRYFQFDVGTPYSADPNITIKLSDLAFKK